MTMDSVPDGDQDNHPESRPGPLPLQQLATDPVPPGPPGPPSLPGESEAGTPAAAYPEPLGTA